jgi:hypothetical protein
MHSRNGKFSGYGRPAGQRLMLVVAQCSMPWETTIEGLEHTNATIATVMLWYRPMIHGVY